MKRVSWGREAGPNKAEPRVGVGEGGDWGLGGEKFFVAWA